jgi:ribulose-phosphate 3-epimerase
MYLIAPSILSADFAMNPGFGGQSFIDAALRKLERARKLIDAMRYELRRASPASKVA